MLILVIVTTNRDFWYLGPSYISLNRRAARIGAAHISRNRLFLIPTNHVPRMVQYFGYFKTHKKPIFLTRPPHFCHLASPPTNHLSTWIWIPLPRNRDCTILTLVIKDDKMCVIDINFVTRHHSSIGRVDGYANGRGFDSRKARRAIYSPKGFFFSGNSGGGETYLS